MLPTILHSISRGSNILLPLVIIVCASSLPMLANIVQITTARKYLSILMSTWTHRNVPSRNRNPSSRSKSMEVSIWKNLSLVYRCKPSNKILIHQGTLNDRGKVLEAKQFANNHDSNMNAMQ